jgi:hypothetical protein
VRLVSTTATSTRGRTGGHPVAKSTVRETIPSIFHQPLTLHTIPGKVLSKDDHRCWFNQMTGEKTVEKPDDLDLSLLSS